MNDSDRQIQELRQTIECLNDAQKIAGVGSWSRDMHSGHLSWSVGTKLVFGWSKDREVTFEEFMSHVHPDDIHQLQEAQKSALDGKTPVYLTYRIIRGDGEIRILQERSLFKYDEHQNLKSLEGVVIDITDRRHMEDALRRAAKESETIFNAIGNPVFILAPDMTVMHVNRATLVALNLTSPISILGKKCHEIFHGACCPPKNCPVLRLLESNRFEIEVMEVQVLGKVFLVSVTPVLNEEGRLEKIIHMATDITAQREQEKKEQQFQNRLLHSQKLESLSLLAGGVAHDFNNILMAIIGNAELALMDLETSHPARDSIKEIEKSAWRAAKLAKQMLDYSGHGHFTAGMVNLSQVVESMRNLMESSVSKFVSVRFDLQKNLPEFQGDIGQIRQIILNLLSNASEAIGENDGVITLKTGVTPGDPKWLEDTRIIVRIKSSADLAQREFVFLEVSDNGCGMDGDIQKRIFDPFFSTRFIGRGLGLSAVLGIVTGHEGLITVKSTPGQGAVFRILFPVHPIEKTESEAPDQGHDVADKKLILIVDDEAPVRQLAKSYLKRLGYATLEAENGEVGIDMFKQRPSEIACVLLDLAMPKMNGEQVLKELNTVWPQVKVIICTAYSASDTSRTLADKNVAAILQKPFSLDDIRTTLDLVLRKQD